MSNKKAIISVFLIVGLVACCLGNFAALVTGPLNLQFPTNEDNDFLATNSDTNYTSISDTVSEDTNVYEVSSDNSHEDTSTQTDTTPQEDTTNNQKNDNNQEDNGNQPSEDTPSDSGSDTGGKSQESTK